MKRPVLLIPFLCLLILVAACRPGKPGARDQITFALDWTPNTNHSGLFLARDRGFYAREGIAIEFRESDMDFIEMVAGGSAEFGMAAQEQVLQARASDAGIPIVALAAVIQRNTSGFASPLDRGIRSPGDFEGKRYSGWGTELELAFIRTLMEKEGADFNKVTIINQSAGNFMASMELEADFAWIYYGWDGINCELEDYPINFIPLQAIEADLDFYSPVIITSEKMIREKPDLIRRFLKATAQGYLEAMEDPQAAVDSLLEAAPGLNRDLLMASQLYLNPRYIDEAPYWGIMRSETWIRFASWMKERGLLEQAADAEQAFDCSFLAGETP
ncbi:MAG TPA: ABC transporter substrate-binding protein [Bacillota bacterium]|jgi:ABC-type nitrate/sulfonate/bicarbonate transport system substrate-binding protein|nr:ABC transporter substrate-binding protein [Fastidiosipila sp.]HPX93682.1 ABC transporter substrate-binding protein [Bacillota bacterium]HQB81414.1 ABC transporter substrate-binding protein [Bacillota bacterium]